MAKIAFTTLGCKLNYAETSTYERALLSAGHEAVAWNEAADVYLINTCAVTTHAEQKSRGFIRRAHKKAPGAAIVVTGCYAELKKQEILAIEGVSAVFGAKEKSLVVPEILRIISGKSDSDVPSSDAALGSEILPAYSSGERTRSFLKVQDGCDNFCAYCTVPFARGRSRNIPVCEAVKQAEAIAAQGIKEIVLTGVNTGDFGRSTGESFLSLLKALNDVEGIERYRISSIEQNLITEEIIDWIASLTKFQPHFHIPLQSGSDTILKKVGRRYDTALFSSRIDYIRQKMEMPGKAKVFFGIDVIVGLPGETEELFRETYSFLADRIKPSFIHIFPYSRRPGTRADKMADQVQDSIKTERVGILEGLCAKLHDDFVAANKGLPEKVLWESSEKDGMMSGYTGNYIRVEAPFDPSKVNTIEDIIL